MRYFTVVLAVVVAVLACAAPTANATDWPTFHQNTALTGVSPDQGPDTNNFAWAPFQTGAAILASPVVADGTIFVGNTAGKFYAVDAATGTQNWMVNMASVHSTAAVAGGIVHVLDDNGVFHGLDAVTGAERPGWPLNLGGPGWNWSSPAVDAGNVFVATANGLVHSLNAGTGAPNWAVQLNGLIFMPPRPAGPIVGASPNSMTAVANGKVYAGTHNMFNGAPTLLALDEANGNVLWYYDYYLTHGGTVGMINCNGATVAEGNAQHPGLEVYFGVFNWPAHDQPPGPVLGPEVVCLDEATGVELWTANINGNSTSTPAVHDGKVFIGSDDGRLYCLDATNAGAVVWSFPTGGFVMSSPAVADGKVYFGSLDHTVYCVDEITGGLVWKYFTGASRLEGSGAVVDGFYYTGNENGNLYAFGVPEPATLSLLALGGLAVIRRRRR